MRIRNYATSPLAEVTGTERIDTNVWHVKGFDKSIIKKGFDLSCDATLLEPPGFIRFGWTPTAYNSSQRIFGRIYNEDSTLPQVTFVITSGKWSMTRLLATTAREDAILRHLAVDYFDATDHPY